MRILLLILALGLPAGAQQTPPKAEEPKAATPQAQPLRPVDAEIVEIQGVVDVKRPGDPDWIPAEVHMKLPAQSEICAAYGAKAVLILGNPNIRFEIGSLTQGKLEELVRGGGAIESGVMLKFGAAEIDIRSVELKAAEIRTEMKVATPESTTSVKGSKGTIHAWAENGRGNFLLLRVHEGVWKTVLDRMSVFSSKPKTRPRLLSDGEGPSWMFQESGVICPDGRTRVDLYFDWLYQETFELGRFVREGYDPLFGTGYSDPAFSLLPAYELNSTQHAPDWYRSSMTLENGQFGIVIRVRGGAGGG